MLQGIADESKEIMAGFSIGWGNFVRTANKHVIRDLEGEQVRLTTIKDV